MNAELGSLFRRESGRMTSALTRLFGVHNLPLVEDVVHDAICRALEVWKYSGVPENPAAWLTQVAKNRAIDRLRRDRTARSAEPDLAAALSTEWSLVPAVDEAFGDGPVRDAQLAMMFACCHARLAEEVQIALVLNLLCGFGARELAQAFLVSDAAMEKRVARGKHVLAEIGRLPELTPERVEGGLPAVQRALYLLFNEGYHGSHEAGAVRAELCREAIRLAELLVSDEATASPASQALLALLCLTGARLPARHDEGQLIALEAQDRTRYDGALIARGTAALEASAEGPALTSYHVEAAIAYEHAIAPSRAETNWRRIVAMYDTLVDLAPSPVVALSRAIAIGEHDGPERALVELARLDDERLASYPFFHAAKAEQLLRAGRHDEARAAFERAVSVARSPDEERYLKGRAAAASP